MSNIAALLKSEISRLSRREIRKEITPLRKSAAGYRRDIAQLKRLVASLDQRTKQLAKQRSTSTSVSVERDRPIRFVAKGLVSLRKRLDLSADELARLLGVSIQSIYNWEQKKAIPRKEQVTAIAALRGIGKREARRRLEAVPSPAPRSAGKRRPPRKVARGGRRRDSSPLRQRSRRASV
jgi:DNA-binding transcriptional regulator YiaG